jgi:hypothetical protein
MLCAYFICRLGNAIVLFALFFKVCIKFFGSHIDNITKNRNKFQSTFPQNQHGKTINKLKANQNSNNYFTYFTIALINFNLIHRKC